MGDRNHFLGTSPRGLLILILLVGSAGAATWTVDPTPGAGHSTTIQDAILFLAGEGDTILVNSGTYTENVVVDKLNLTLRGNDTGGGLPVVNATIGGTIGDAITLAPGADGCTLEGFVAMNCATGIFVFSSSNTISGNTATGPGNGIVLLSSSNNNISGNTVNDSNTGIFLSSSSNNNISGNIATRNIADGIALSSSSNGNIISGNTVTDNGRGIGLYSSSNGNIISGNTVTGNDLDIYLDYSSNNKISGNNVTDSDRGIYLYQYSNDNNISGNTATGNTYGIYLNYFCNNNNISDNTATGNTYGIYLYESSNYNHISDNTATGNTYGIYLYYICDNNNISANTATGNTYGISLEYCIDNIISGNTVNGNDRGIYLNFFSNNNIIYLNIFSNNLNARSTGTNRWNATTNQTYEHQGRILTGLLGNIWSDYDGFDCDGDGIGDTPYAKIEQGPHEVDYHPIGGRAAGPAIEVEKVADRDEAGIGEMINYSIWVNNTGNVTLAGVWAEDNLTGAVWEVGTLLPGENYTNSTSYLVKETDLPGSVTNELRANGTDPCHTEVNDSCVETVSIFCVPGVAVNKTANVSSAEVGDIVEYTILVNNIGNVNLTNVVASDNLTVDAWNIGTLAPGKNYTNKTTYRIKEPDLGKDLVNNATANGTGPCGARVANFSLVSIGTTCTPRIEVEKFANVSSAEVGDIVEYTILVNNTGNVNLTGVSAFDNLTGTAWNIGTLAPGQSYTNSTQYPVKEADLPGPIANRLSANGTDPLDTEVNDSFVETVSIIYDPAIEVEKTANLSFGAPSTTIEFRINVTNTGNVNFSTVNLTDHLPAGLEYVSDDQPTRTIYGDNVTWNLGDLNRTHSKTIELVAHIDGTVFGTLKNRAEAAGTAPLGDEVTDDDEAEVDALKAEIEVEKTGEVDYGPASTNATFTIKVRNAGNITLKKVEVVDVIPASLIYLSSSPAGTEVGNTITWPNIGPLAEEETAEIEIFTRVDGAASGSLTNEVTVTGTPEHGRNVTDQDNATVMATLDFGDAPDPSYPTLLSSDGARHVIIPGFMLGSEIDGEHDGQPTAAANGDDMAGVDDEDGVAFTTYLVPGGMANVEVKATASGKLDAWIDFDDDGSWSATDQRFNSEPISSGTNYLQFAVPGTATPGVVTFARFRFSSAGGLSPTGLADDGEVEDCTVEILKDSDGDGVPDLLEGQGDRDGDGIQNHLDYDPSGYFYNESDGQIIFGGKIEVTGPGNVTIKKDGSDGRYEFWTDGTPQPSRTRSTWGPARTPIRVISPPTSAGITPTI
jgi:uncharacterized repeat protein (TIGR01451 family)